MKEVQCYCCQRFDHYASDCYSNKDSSVKNTKEAQYTHTGGGESHDVLLTSDTQYSDDKTKVWYLGFGCNNHMTWNKE